MLNWNLIPRLLHNAAFDAFVTIIVDCCAKTRWVGLNCLLEEEGRWEMEGLEGLIDRLMEGRKNNGKKVQLIEPEIRQLCITAKQVFLSQPNLLQFGSSN